MKTNVVSLNTGTKSEIGENWSIAAETFLKNCEARNLRSRTIQYYEGCLISSFIPFIQKIKITPNTFSSQHTDLYILHMKEKGNVIESVNIRLRALRAFLNYLFENEYIEKKVKVRMVKSERKIIQAFSEDQLKNLLEKDKKYDTFAQYRDYVIVNFLLGTGVRLATLERIKIEDIDFVEREIRLEYTKNREQYIIPLSITLSKILQEYLKTRCGQPEDYLFCNTYGEMLQDRTIEKRIKNYCISKIGNSEKIRYSPHTFRHTFAITYIRNGGDLLTLQKLMGHKSLEMTRRYVNLLGKDIKLKFSEFSPLDNIKNVKNTGRKAIKLK